MGRDFITIVSGLPRSGTSLMMQVLEAGGVPILKDDNRAADPDNPKGYYEFERVKQIAHDQTWLEDARGKAIKMVSALLLELPNTHTYKVIFMRRRMEEVLASQKTMLKRTGKPTDAISDEKMAALFRKHLSQVEKWINEQSNVRVLYVSYNDMLAAPLKDIEQINQFLGSELDTGKMASVVDRTLYRQQSTNT